MPLANILPRRHKKVASLEDLDHLIDEDEEFGTIF